MKASAEEMASVGFNYLGVPYSRMDCQAFVETCLKACGITMNLPGSNAWFRKMTWTGTPAECKEKFGQIPVGSFLFILKQDGKEPEKYKGDGIGNASHIGIKTGRGEGAINSSNSRGCVCESKFQDKAISGGWNRVGLWVEVDYGPEINRILEGREEEPMNEQARVTAEDGGTVNLRAGKSTSSARLGKIPVGTIVTIVARDGAWAKIIANGQSGWMMNMFLEPVEETGIGEPASDGPAEPELITVNRDDLMKAYNMIGNMLGYRG